VVAHAEDARALAGEPPARRRLLPGRPRPRPQPPVSGRDPPGDVHRQHHGGVGHVLVEDRCRGHDDPPLAGGGEVGALEPDPEQRDDLQFRQGVHDGRRHADHGAGDDSADPLGRGPQRGGDVRGRPDLVQREVGGERLEHGRAHRADHDELHPVGRVHAY
jgi:hypothetical protein